MKCAANPEDLLRPTSHSFTVEVKRHRNRLAVENAWPILRETSSDALREISRDHHKTNDQASGRVFESDAARHTGRILPSLLEGAPWLVARSETKPRGANGAGLRGGTTERKHDVESVVFDSGTPKSPRRHADAGSTRLATANGFSRQARSIDAPTASLFSLSANPTEVERNAKTSKAGKRTQRPTDRAESPASERTDVESAPNFDPRLADQSKSDDEGDRKRRRPILARYVFGTELKPGERWKRRLRHVN
jgi:hypothetical protein